MVAFCELNEIINKQNVPRHICNCEGDIKTKCNKYKQKPKTEEEKNAPRKNT